MNNIKVFTTPSSVSDTSLFKNITDKHPMDLSWNNLVNLIRSNNEIEYNTLTARNHYAQGNNDLYAKYKSLSGAITPAARCLGGHAAANIQQLTGIAMVDFDHVDPAEMNNALARIINDPHTFIAHITCSGNGIRVLAKYNATEPQIAYLDAWNNVNQYYAMLTSLNYDKATKDATRLSFLCHDEHCHFNPDSKPFVIDNTPRIDLPQPSSTEQLISQAEQILQRQGNQFIPGQRHSYILNAAFLLNKMGVSKSDVVAHFRSLHDDPQEVNRIVDWCYSHATSQHGKWLNTMPHYETPSPQSTNEDKPAKKGNQRLATPMQIRQYLDKHVQLRFNLLANRLEYLSEHDKQWIPLTDTIANTIWHDLNQNLDIYVRKDDFNNEINTLYTQQFNPYLDYLEHLPEWNPSQPDYIAELASRVHTTAPDGLFLRCLRIWLVAMVNSWLNPGTANQTILVLLGKQGIYKSTFFRKLLPPELINYFLVRGNANRMSKDDKLALTQYLLVALEEIDSLKDFELNAIKAVVTTEVISERAAYDRHRTDRHHIASFCATGNNITFLTDTTGNRRWLPFEVLDIDNPNTHPINYQGLYSQILYLIHSGFQCWFDNAENEQMEEYKKQFTEPNLEEEIVLRYFRKPLPGDIASFFTTGDIVAHIADNTKMKIEPQKLGKTLVRIFGKKVCKGKQKGFKLYAIPYEERKSNQVNEATELIQSEHTTSPTETQTNLIAPPLLTLSEMERIDNPFLM